MTQHIVSKHEVDEDGQPAGGLTTAQGLQIQWQAGPVGPAGAEAEPNGTFVETVIIAAIDRLRFFQASQFACEQNEQAIKALEMAGSHLRQRTEDRILRGVKGTLQV